LEWGHNQDFTLGGQKLSAEGARIDAPSSKAPRELGIRKWVSPALTDYVAWGSSLSGVRGGALAANVFLAYFRPTDCTEHFW